MYVTGTAVNVTFDLVLPLILELYVKSMVLPSYRTVVEIFLSFNKLAWFPLWILSGVSYIEKKI